MGMKAFALREYQPVECLEQGGASASEFCQENALRVIQANASPHPKPATRRLQTANPARL
jgi:hypothetical protein